MNISRALSEHKQRQRLNFLERVKQETRKPPVCHIHHLPMTNCDFSGLKFKCSVIGCLAVFEFQRVVS